MRSTDGALPYGITMDAQGNLYGATQYGGDLTKCKYGCGVLFKVTPAGVQTVVHTFEIGPKDGAFPVGVPYVDPKGDLFGATEYGDPSNHGVGYEYESPGTFRTIFPGRSGPINPMGGVSPDGHGNFYGPSNVGNGNKYGAIYRVNSFGKLTTFLTFDGTNGSAPNGGLIFDAAGNLYGTTAAGGSNDGGVVFEISPSGQETILYQFPTFADGSRATGGLVMDASGNLYGTAASGGAHFYGVVFKLTP